MFKSVTKKHFPLLLLVLVNLIIGMWILPDYGESVDELSQNSYAGRTIQAIQSLISSGHLPASFYEEQPKQGSHGPAFIVVVTLLKRLFLAGGDKIDRLYFGHFLYFLVFQVGVVSIYFLAKRWVSEIAAFGTAILFNTQPILFGHAFMNPKDVVFMSLISASTALGLWMLERGGKTFQATGRPLRDGLRSFLLEFRSADVWFAGLLLGFSSAIRIAAPLVGVIILIQLFISRKWQLLPRFFTYGVIAFSFMVLFWPFLWPDPITRLAGSIFDSANYPDVHITLFKGVLFDAKDIPRSYLPVLLGVQLTETTLLLILLGCFSLLKKIRLDFVALALIWFVLPAALIILAGVNLYNNLRQVFFIFPPLFLTAGLGLDWLFTFAKRPALRYLLIFLVLIPGLVANISLHPYQYIYYNQLVGGVGGAYRKFELDYWNLAFKEAQYYVNANADKNADIFVDKSKYVAQTFARPDLTFNTYGAKDWKNYDFIIVSTAQNSDLMFADLPTLFVVELQGVPLAFVKKP